MTEYDFTKIKDRFVPEIYWIKKRFRFLIIVAIVSNFLVLIFRVNLTYESVIFPVIWVLLILVYKYSFHNMIFKVSVDEKEMTLNLEKEVVKIDWTDIDHVYIWRLMWTGVTILKIKAKKTDNGLSRSTFQLLVTALSREGKKALVKLLKEIENYTKIRSNKIIKNDIKKWG
jgi:hypothetical protein